MKSALDIRKEIIDQVVKPVLKLGRSHWALRCLQHREQDFLRPGLPMQCGDYKGVTSEKGGFPSFTRARTGALQKWAVVTTIPGTGLISSGFRSLDGCTWMRWPGFLPISREKEHDQHSVLLSLVQSSHQSWHQSAFLHVASKGCPREYRCQSLYWRYLNLNGMNLILCFFPCIFSSQRPH